MTGKLGRHALGVLLTDDRSEGAKARFGVFRYSRDVGDQSSLGLVYTHRDSPGRRNDVGGLDGRLKINSRWTATFQAVTSSTRLPDGRSLAGPAYEAPLSRAGRSFNYNLEFKDRSPGFRTEVGFDPRPDIRSLHQLLSYRFRPEGRRIVSWGPDFVVEGVWDHDGSRVDRAVGPAIHWEFTGQTSFGVYYLDAREALRPRDHPGVESTTSFPTSRWGVLFGTRFIQEVALDAHVYSGRATNLLPFGGQPPASHPFTRIELGVVLRPLTALTVDHRWLGSRLAGVFTTTFCGRGGIISGPARSRRGSFFSTMRYVPPRRGPHWSRGPISTSISWLPTSCTTGRRSTSATTATSGTSNRAGRGARGHSRRTPSSSS